MSEPISDPKALRALSHPTRWKLIELLDLEDTATATRCAEFTGESVASCSYHLNMLAKYGFVEQADSRGGREKPWRLKMRRLSVRQAGLDGEAVLAAEVLTEVYVDYESGRMKEYVRRASQENERWQTASGTWAAVAHLAVEEAEAVAAELAAITNRFRDREEDPAARPDGARPVRLFLAAYPATPPAGEGVIGVDPLEHHVRRYRMEMEAAAAAPRLARGCVPPSRPSLLLRLYARLWWASRPRAAAWTPGLFDPRSA